MTFVDRVTRARTKDRRGFKAADASGRRNTPHRVIVIGSGFGGLAAARALNHPSVSVTVIDRRARSLE